MHTSPTVPQNCFSRTRLAMYPAGMRSALLFILVLASTARAQVTHYTVRLTPDLDHHILRGEETIEFQHDAGTIKWQKQRGLQITDTKISDGEPALADEAVSISLRRGGKHVLRFEYAPRRTQPDRSLAE